MILKYLQKINYEKLFLIYLFSLVFGRPSYAQGIARVPSALGNFAQQAIKAGSSSLGSRGSRSGLLGSCPLKASAPTTPDFARNPYFSPQRRFYQGPPQQNTGGGATSLKSDLTPVQIETTAQVSAIIKARFDGEGRAFNLNDWFYNRGFSPGNIDHMSVDWHVPDKIALGLAEPNYLDESGNPVPMSQLKDFAAYKKSKYFNDFPSQALIGSPKRGNSIMPISLILFHNIDKAKTINFNLSGINLNLFYNIVAKNQKSGPFRIDIFDAIRTMSIQDNSTNINLPLLNQGRSTMYELNIILSNPEFFAKTNFYIQTNDPAFPYVRITDITTYLGQNFKKLYKL